MKHDIYDDPQFFEGYRRMREDPDSANEIIEQPALRACLPSLEGLEVLELGCGMGHLSLYLAEAGAARVLATDASERMLAVARSERAHERVEYRLCSMEDLELRAESFYLVASSLSVHYVADHAALVAKVARWLRPGGRFVYSVEHPFKTAPENPDKGWVGDDAEDEGFHWPLRGYCEEGVREQNWYAESVVKYHRKLSSMLNDLAAYGMVVERVEEPEEVLKPGRAEPVFPQNRHRPSILVLRSAKGS